MIHRILKLKVWNQFKTAFYLRVLNKSITSVALKIKIIKVRAVKIFIIIYNITHNGLNHHTAGDMRNKSISSTANQFTS
jgi:hypothetical protein